MRPDWVCCPNGRGYRHEDGQVSSRVRHFKKKSVGVLESDDGKMAVVWLIGLNERWTIKSSDLTPIEVKKTGDKHKRKICNICHCLLPVTMFSINQRNKERLVRRPSCKPCRTDIDKREPKSQQAKQMEKRRPKRGTPFQCPICHKRSIAGVTARVVADHNHHTGDIRDFICDSCNTGLGRFKNGQDCLRDAIEYIEEREGALENA